MPQNHAASAQEPLGLGERIRAVRRERRIPLKDLAAALGVSPSAVSQMERGVTRPAVHRLPLISETLGVSLMDLFAGGSAAGTTSLVVSRRGEAPLMEMADGVTYRRLSAGRLPGLDLFESTWQPGARSGADLDTMSHGGWEGGTVTAGTLRVEVDDTTVVLEAGDSISYAATARHRLTNPSDSVVATAIWAIRS
ncbi:helix-turn-helix domain-containing protein [Rathayibacter caricis]|uniref:helix-turn-helix domain-containing protein n=1 Tax=Rathayibacter caricis TaxID=110936 RepID=UPI001FB29F71|nr:helix-turn-helix domain-containing protein [Rathayibacter caricis]MCJ1697349.1 helix-turn-helix domain-containing protein [Rathayibacter caricis]